MDYIGVLSCPVCTSGCYLNMPKACPYVLIEICVASLLCLIPQASPMPLSFFQFPVSFPLSRFLSEFLLSLLVCELYLLNSEIFAKFVIIV